MGAPPRRAETLGGTTGHPAAHNGPAHPSKLEAIVPPLGSKITSGRGSGASAAVVRAQTVLGVLCSGTMVSGPALLHAMFR